MPPDPPHSKFVIVATGDATTELIDDVFSATVIRHSLAPGKGLADADDHLTLTPLYFRPSAAVAGEGNEGEEGGEEWRGPPPLYIAAPDSIITVDTADQLGAQPEAVSILESGGAVKIRMPHVAELRISELGELAYTARSNPGVLIVEMYGDG